MSKTTLKYNTSNFKFNIDFENVEFIKISDFFENESKIYPVEGIYANTKSNFGISYSILTNNKLVSVPQHLNKNMQAILDDDEAVAEIKSNKICFGIRPYKKDNKIYYTIEFLDNDEQPF